MAHTIWDTSMVRWSGRHRLLEGDKKGWDSFLQAADGMCEEINEEGREKKEVNPAGGQQHMQDAKARRK